MSWAGRRLWIGVPWVRDIGSTASVSSVFVFDTDVGNGAWTMYRSNYGAVGPVLDGSDVNAKYPLAALWSDLVACMVTLDYIPDAYDMVLDPTSLAADDTSYLVTTDGMEIAVTGPNFFGQPFDSYYRTRWLHAGWPDRKKSWRRPTFIAARSRRTSTCSSRRSVTTTRPRCTAPARCGCAPRATATGPRPASTEAEIGGFDWTEGGRNDPSGRGADWGLERRGSNMIRAGSMGLARSVQMRVRASPASPRLRWGIDGIVAKFVNRRFR